MAQTRQKYVHLKWFHEFFPCKFQQIQIISVSGHFIHFIFTICQTTAADISNGPNLQNRCSLEVISRIFPSKFQKIQITSVSGHFLHFIFKICQTTADISNGPQKICSPEVISRIFPNNYSRFKSFPYPFISFHFISFTSYSKFVKLLQTYSP